MRKTKKAIASLAIAGMVLSMAPLSVFGATTDSNRLAGAGRVETAIAIAAEGWTTSDSVIVVPADDANIVDALAAAPLAGQLNAPILVTYKGALDPQVQAEIVKLGAKNVYAVGALSADTVASLKAISGVTVTALQGADRTETAAKVAAQLTGVKGSFVVAYDGKADALSAASFAAANDYSIVIANPDGTIPASEKVVAPTYTVGGQVTVAGATPLAGADRYATNDAVVDGLDFDFDAVYVANGQSLVDALAGAPLAAQTNSPIVLGDAVDVATGANDNLTSSSKVIALGGTGAVSDSVLAKVAYEAPATLAVESVSAINLVQLEVELSNTNYDKDELQTEANYEFEGDDQNVSGDSAVDIDVLDATVEGTVLTLTLDSPVENQSEGTLVIDDAVIGEELEFEGIEFYDSSLPKIEEVKVIGEDTVKVIFSEPIFDLANMEDEFDFELDGKSYSVDSVVPVDNGTEANISVYGAFTDGTLTLEVGNGLEDYAGFNVIANSYELDVTEDTEGPVVTAYKDADSDEVTLVFDEDVRLSGDEELEDFYHTNSNNQIDDTDNDGLVELGEGIEIDGNKVTLHFTDNELPDGTAYVYISSGALEDFWGNENNSIKVNVETELDAINPAVDEVEFDGEDVVITFSELLDDDSAEDVDNYKLVDPNGDELSIRSASYTWNSDDEGIVTLDVRDTDLDEGTYTLTISDVEDVAGNEVDEYTTDVELTDSSSEGFPTTVYVDEVTAGDEYKLFVEFSEAMDVDGTYSIADLYNYQINVVSPVGVINLGDADEDEDDGIEVSIKVSDGNKTAEITVEGFDFAIGTDTITIARVADADGNTTAFSSGAITTAALTNRVILIEDATATARDTIEVDFDGNLDDIEANDFFVFADNGAGANANNGVKDADEVGYDIESINVIDGDEIVIELEDKVPAAVETSVITLGTVADANIDTENAFGALLDGAQAFAVTDEVAPGVSTLNNVDTDKVFGNAGSDDSVKSIYAEYDADGDVTPLADQSYVYIQFNETVQYVNNATFTVNGGDNRVISVIADGSTDGLVKLLVEGEVLRGDDIEVNVIYDNAPVSNSSNSMEVQIEYLVKSI